MGRRGYVYILASQKNGTLYVGVTSDLAGRLLQHQTGTGSKFVARYGVMRLVWFDEYDLVVDAVAREKVIKKWPRQWKINLIEERNPHWHDIRGICFDGRHFVALVLHRRLALPFRHGFPTLSTR
ncbi:GIY-YIG nuclease family protein [Mesorhizobium sp. DCY119]|uniref:GIY-YIG nuclease family protein n=1 Tax=Mesorhizobium sp. DCY119 TaxID=2108445 RepID=UPI000E6CF225|nr:GIY-YIG nuclease family protein [Mesorhizobium sp. DCY119]RJG44954.1 GIY-YIG nuclease family protein [Mesorhizobium sp. DCY119]